MGAASSVPGKTSQPLQMVLKKSFTNNVVDTSSSFRLSMIDLTFPDHEWKSKVRPKSDENRKLIMNVLRKKFIFKAFTKNELNDITDAFQPVICEAGKEIVRAGYTGKYMYIVDEGSFEERSIKSANKRKYSEDDSFGHLSLLYNNLSKSITCLETAKLWALSRETFRYYLISHSFRLTRWKFEMFKKISFFKDLDTREKIRLAEITHVEECEKDDIINETIGSDDNNMFYIIIDGKVKSSNGPFGENKLLLKSGDCFDNNGWISTSNRMSSGSSSPPSSPNSARKNCGIKQNMIVESDGLCLLVFKYVEFEKVIGRLIDLLDRSLKQSLLRDLSFMETLSSEKIKMASDLFVTKTFQNGEVIAQCGDPNAQLVVIKSGEAIVWHHPTLHLSHLYQPLGSSSSSKLKKHDKNVFITTASLSSKGLSASERSDDLSNSETSMANTTSFQTKQEQLEKARLLKQVDHSRHSPGTSVRSVRENCFDASSLRLSMGGVDIDRQAEVEFKLPSNSREEELMVSKRSNRMRSRSYSMTAPLVGVNIDDSEPLDDPPMMNDGVMNFGGMMHHFNNDNGNMGNCDMYDMGGGGVGMDMNYDEPHGSPPVVSSTSTIRPNSTAVTQSLFPGILNDNGSDDDDDEAKAMETTRSEEEEKAEERDEVEPLSAVPTKRSIKDSACFDVVVHLLNSARSSCSSSLNSSLSSESDGDSFGSNTPTNKDSRGKSNRRHKELNENNIVPRTILTNKTKQHKPNAIADSSTLFPVPKTKDFHRHLEAFQLKSYFTTFTHSIQGKKEFFWRKSIIFMKDEYESMNINKIRADMADRNHNMSHDLFNESNTEILQSGDHIGSNAVSNGTMMDSTMIAKGTVTCYILTRSSYTELLKENIDSNFYDNVKADEIKWSNLTNSGLLGEGTFGSVYLMENKIDQKKYALKFFDRSKVSTTFYMHRIESEISFLAKIKSRHTSKYYKNGENAQGYYILMDYVSGGDMRQIIHPTLESAEIANQGINLEKLQGISHQAAKFYIASISLPLLHLHRRGIAYRDLKPENIMIDRHGYPKLIDFGLSKQFNFGAALMKGVDIGKTYTLCGTPEYMAPEVILGRGHNHAVDWWSLGIVLYEMVVGVTPFAEFSSMKSEDTHSVVFQNIVNNQPYFPVDMEDQCKSLIQGLLVDIPSARINCSHRGDVEFQEHEWFRGVIDWYALNIKQMTPPWFPNS